MRYKKGDIVEGKVISLKPYGAFICLPNDESGLLHISEISHEYINNIESVLEVGDRIKVRILDMDPKNHHITFSRRALLKPKRKTKNKYSYTRRQELRMESKKGFEPLKQQLPKWIDEYK